MNTQVSFCIALSVCNVKWANTACLQGSRAKPNQAKVLRASLCSPFLRLTASLGSVTDPLTLNWGISLR